MTVFSSCLPLEILSSILRVSFEVLECLFSTFLRADSVCGVKDDAILVDHELTADNAHVFLPVHRFLSPGSIEICQFVIWINEEVKGQIVSSDELLMGNSAVRTYAQNHRTRASISGKVSLKPQDWVVQPLVLSLG